MGQPGANTFRLYSPRGLTPACRIWPGVEFYSATTCGVSTTTDGALTGLES
jgi:hypothetical protein